MELKTSKELTSPRAIASFQQHKLLKFWAQSFLLGVPRIVVGFRSERNVLVSTQMLETMKIPAQVRERAGWDGNICINFAAKFLDFIKHTVDETSVWGISYVAGSNTLQVSPKATATSFLPQDYVSYRST
jgi:RAT1-interacting protein